MKITFSFSQNLAGLLLLIASSVQAAPITFANHLLVNNPATIDFEPLGSGSTLVSINNRLSNLGLGATLSYSGGQARIDDLTDNEYANIWHVSAGADGGPVSGSWGFEGGSMATSTLTIAFASSHYVESIGAFWGGVLYPARTTVTFEDNSVSSFLLSSLLPSVSDSAPASAAINGFFGINGNGLLIKQASFENSHDVFSIDDVMFSSSLLPNNPVPEPGILWILGIGLISLCLSKQNNRQKIAI